MVKAFSRRTRRANLVVVGTLDDGNPYHRAVKAAASTEIIFPGAIYDRTIVQALRFHARAYCHGHTVGGTNPSLVESLWCGNAVLAHQNRFNVWTAGEDQFFFSDEDECERVMGQILTDDVAVARARAAARERAAADFHWADVLGEYEHELASLGGYVPVRQRRLPVKLALGSGRRS
jgi:glycosyltransferase involved in cell wall biosynthesis